MIKQFKLFLPSSSLFKLAKFFSPHSGTSFLYSGGNYQTASHSFLSLFPYEFLEIHCGKQIHYHANQKKKEGSYSNPWDFIKAHISPSSSTTSYPEWVGFFSYEMGGFSDEEKRIPGLYATTPEAYWQKPAVILKVNRQTDEAEITLVEAAKDFVDPTTRDWIELLSTEEGWQGLIQQMSLAEEIPQVQAACTNIHVSETFSSYEKKIEGILDLIRHGVVYQVNLSQQFTVLGNFDSFSLFEKIMQLNPAPFAAYLNLDKYAIVSSSPERFLLKKGAELETRPIKGTAPRGKTAEEDARMKEILLKSEKERAELLMITDLMRNDLGKISLPGSVKTPHIWQCEAYKNVFHLHSIVCSTIKPEIHPVDAVRSCFPGGSISGCPKLSAMEVIANFEKRPRGIYTGSIGYFTSDGDFDLNIAIRTLVIHPNSLTLQLGGGIVIDSDPKLEYEETLHKGKSLFETLGINFTL